ncbi:MAG: nitroreductase family protein [Candidatus Riflebacteria bacterium]|nr:nitroreductase family protein [Candidatus Riflebacteria bacterium]
MITIDHQTCSHCGLCSKHCLWGLISMNPDKQPQLTANYEQICIKCGQCAAICPKSAISFSESGIETWETISKDQATFSQFSALVKNRRSIRHYQDKLIPTEILLQLLDLARYSPTGKNAQAVKWLIINGKDKIRNLSALCIDWFIKNNIMGESARTDFENDNDIINRGAPHLVIAYADKETPAPAEDCIIALRTLELAAQTINLGSCWAGFFKWAACSHRPVFDLLKITENYSIHGALMLGYPKYKYTKIPVRKMAEVTFM